MMIPVEPDAARRLLAQIAEGTARYACQFHVQIGWPQLVTHGGRDHHRTGKEGIRRSDGMPSAEYQAAGGRRLWLGVDGQVNKD